MEEHVREEAYRVYVTDSLKIIGGLNLRYLDFFKPQETRTAEEIVQGVRDKLDEIGGK